jgi:hypothetical protein
MLVISIYGELPRDLLHETPLDDQWARYADLMTPLLQFTVFFRAHCGNYESADPCSFHGVVQFIERNREREFRPVWVRIPPARVDRIHGLSFVIFDPSGGVFPHHAAGDLQV